MLSTNITDGLLLSTIFKKFIFLCSIARATGLLPFESLELKFCYENDLLSHKDNRRI